MNPVVFKQKKLLEELKEQEIVLVRDIGKYTAQLDQLTKSTTEKGAALQSLNESIAEAKGRMAEIEDAEKRYKDSVNNEIIELSVRKSQLESEITVKEAEISALDVRKEEISSEISTLVNIQDKVFGRVSSLEKVMANIVEAGDSYVSNILTKSEKIGGIFEQMIIKGRDNVKQTNIVLEKLPKYIFELQRPIPIRRAPRGMVIEPEKKNEEDNNDK